MVLHLSVRHSNSRVLMSPDNTSLQPASSPLTIAVVKAVADREGVDAAELPPLRTVIDPDALNSLFAYATGEFPHPEGRVVFQYCGYTIVVYSDGQLAVEE